MQGIFDVIRIPFGFIIEGLYGLFNSYLVAILLFAVILKVVMFPFGIKQQKNSQKQASLRPKENVIRKKYAGRSDRATQLKLNTEIQELYQKENFSPFGGCLPMVVQMLVLIAVYAVVRAPLTYTAPLPTAENFDTAASVKQTVAYMIYQDDQTAEEKKLSQILNVKADCTEQEFWDAMKAGNFNYNAEIFVLNYLESEENRAEFCELFDKSTHYNLNGEAVSVGNGLEFKGEDVVAELPDLELFSGFNLGKTPDLGMFRAESWGEKLILIIPVITLVTSYFGQSLTRKFTYQPELTKEMKSQNRIMNVFMPLFSLYISFQVPVAVGIYWIVQNMLGPVQQIVLAKCYPIAEITPEQMREAEREYGGKQKKKKANASLDGKKKKSLVYDDDDEYESVSTVQEKKVLKEKENTEKDSLIGKAPLKDDEKTEK